MILALTGYKGSGKNETANILRDYNVDFFEYSFANPLKEICKIIFGFTDEDYLPENKDKKGKYGISPREAWISFGDDYIKKYLCNTYSEYKEIVGNNFWVKKFEEVMQQTDENKLVIITDLRFPQELEAIQKFKHKVVLIDRQEKVPDLAQETEKYISSFPVDYIINNNSTKIELRKQVQNLIYYYNLLDY